MSKKNKRGIKDKRLHSTGGGIMMVPWSGRWVRVSISEQRQNNPHNPLNFQLDNQPENALIFSAKLWKLWILHQKGGGGLAVPWRVLLRRTEWNFKISLSKFHKYIYLSRLLGAGEGWRGTGGGLGGLGGIGREDREKSPPCLGGFGEDREQSWGTCCILSRQPSLSNRHSHRKWPFKIFTQ